MEKELYLNNENEYDVDLGREETLDGEVIADTAEDLPGEGTVCLNCHTVCLDKFCPHCGQPTSTPPKLKMRNFGKSLIMSFGRLTPGFWNTVKGLLIAPWNVMRDHIHGRHVRYSPPITALIQIALYGTIIFTLIDGLFGTSLVSGYFNSDGTLGLAKASSNPLVQQMDQSTVFEALFVGIPTCFVIYLVYFRHGSRKYNFAEYLACFVYLFGAINLVDMILYSLNLLPGIDFDTSFITMTVASVWGVIIITKAFPNKWWKHLLLIPLAIIVTYLFFIAIILFEMKVLGLDPVH